jgi:polyhydroxybutyrate depolymerase
MTARSDARRRRGVIGAVLVFLGLPPALALVEAVRFHIANRDTGTIVSSGETREYLLFVPRSYDRSKPTPLVISMHGAALWGAAQMELSKWNEVADREGFIVVYPSGVRGAGPRHWREEDGSREGRDVRFISELIDTLRASYNIDPRMIYANGLSNGGGMAFVLSCTLSDRIAAIGVVAPALFLPWSACTDRRAVPMIAFHGTADPAAPYHGGTTWVAPQRFPDIPKWTATWARRNRCAPDPIDSPVATDVTRRSYTSCAEDAAVVLYTIRGGGHTWPGGKPPPEWSLGPTNRSIDASRLMWEFFREHQLPRN